MKGYIFNGCFLVPLVGARKARTISGIFLWYFLPIGGLYGMYHLSWEPGFTPLIYPPFDRTHRKTRHLHLDLLTFCPKKATRGILIPWLRKLFKRRYWSGARKEIFVVDNVDARQKKNMENLARKIHDGNSKKQPLLFHGCVVICNHFLCTDLVHHI